MNNKRIKCIQYILLFCIAFLAVYSLPLHKAKSAENKSVKVNTIKKLTEAINNSDVQEITFSSKKKVKLNIPKITDTSNNIVINASKATIVNNGSFGKITIKAAKKYTEKGNGNNIDICGESIKLYVGKKIYVNQIYVAAMNTNVKIYNNAIVNDLRCERVGAYVYVDNVSEYVSITSDIGAYVIQTNGYIWPNYVIHSHNYKGGADCMHHMICRCGEEGPIGDHVWESEIITETVGHEGYYEPVYHIDCTKHNIHMIGWTDDEVVAHFNDPYLSDDHCGYWGGYMDHVSNVYHESWTEETEKVIDICALCGEIKYRKSY